MVQHPSDFRQLRYCPMSISSLNISGRTKWGYRGESLELAGLERNGLALATLNSATSHGGSQLLCVEQEW